MSTAGVREKVLRVSQLDATELDEELSTLLQDQFVAIFRSLPSTKILQLKPELRAFVRLLLWRSSVYSHGRTFGQDMMDLSYSSGAERGAPISPRHKLAFFFVVVLSDWFKERIHLFFPRVSPSSVEKWLSRLLATIKTLSLLNFLVFLLRGHYPTLFERVLCLVMTANHPQSLRQISCDYMNREILWHGFYEFVFFVLPHFNLFAAKNWLRKMLASNRDTDCQSTRKLTVRDFMKCSFCEMLPTMPCVTSCGHLYCYYCIQANCLADQTFPCSTCGVPVESWEHAHFDPEEEEHT